LDLLVLLIKNWHDDPTIGFEAKSGPQDVDKFGKAKEEILDLLDVEFFDEIEGHVEDCVQNWDMYP
jgi:tetrahydromethanopterin S-methyltransferase subunit A